MNEHQVAARGDRAAHELQETEAAFDKVRADLIQALIETPIGQTPKIERLHISLSILAGVKKALMQVATNGQVARHAIAAETTLLRPH